MVLALLGKAVPAGKIAVMGNVQTQRFYHGRPLFEIHDIILIGILRKKLSRIYERLYLVNRFLCFRPAVLFRQSSYNFIPGIRFRRCPVNPLYNVIGDIVHYMNRSAVYIQNNIIAVILILMNHYNISSLSISK